MRSYLTRNEEVVDLFSFSELGVGIFEIFQRV